jgi:hypothetical protein
VLPCCWVYVPQNAVNETYDGSAGRAWRNIDRGRRTWRSIGHGRRIWRSIGHGRRICGGRICDSWTRCTIRRFLTLGIGLRIRLVDGSSGTDKSRTSTSIACPGFSPLERFSRALCRRSKVGKHCASSKERRERLTDRADAFNIRCWKDGEVDMWPGSSAVVANHGRLVGG